jgi:hypothetical protein
MKRLPLFFRFFIVVLGMGMGQPAFAEEPVPTTPYIYSSGPVQPFLPLSVCVAIPNGPSGAASLIVNDARMRTISSTPIELVNGSACTNVTPRGAAGTSAGIVWMPNGTPEGAIIATNPALYTLSPTTEVRTGVERYDQFIPAATTIMRGAILDLPAADGSIIHGYRSPDSPLIWLRDHVYQMRGARYFDADMTSTLNAFAALQSADGSFPDYLARAPYADVPYRTPVETDVEFLFIQGVYQAWQVGAGDEFARGHLAGLRRAVNYSLQNPLRWDAAKGLLRRPFTIDTWDFEVTWATAPRHEIDGATRWGIFHGDNTGMVQSLRMLATLEERVGDPALAAVWRSIADGIIQRLNALSWNGQFYRHFVFDQPHSIPGLDMEQQLSLSNAYALNRGVLDDAQSDAIIDTYISRRRDGVFAEWYSIDPPFPVGVLGLGGRAGEIPGTYVNGGIMPMVGGELARGAFRMGRSTYGFATLDYYWLGMLSRGRSFLWYAPDGAEGVGTPDTLSTDGWGAATMLNAFVEGAVGVVDQSDNFRTALVSPQWFYAGLTDAAATVRYATGSGYVAYRWHHDACWASVDVTGADAYQVAIPIPMQTTGCSGVVSSPNGTVRIVERREGRVAVIDVSTPEATVVVSW